MSCCSAPPFHVGDGLGWGTEVMFICLNDECSLYVNGWQHISEQYAHTASYRWMVLPGEKSGTPLMVGSKDAFTGCIIDPEKVMQKDPRYIAEQKALTALDSCLAQGNLEPVLTLLLDEAASMVGREKACDLLTELNDVRCLDPLRNHVFANEALKNRVNLAIGRILKANFKKECPHCAEIIKAHAKFCMHCKQAVE